MHTAPWDHSVDLAGKRVAVLGTGSTASQVLPEIAKVAAQVYSVQRSPTWILPKPDRRLHRPGEVGIRARPVRQEVLPDAAVAAQRVQHLGDRERQRQDPGVQGESRSRRSSRPSPTRSCARKLTPEHPLGCKRLVFVSDYLPTLTQPHVEVVSSPARALRSASLVTEDGRELDVDVVVCATGYAAADYLGQIDVIGENGVSLHETWRDGAYAYLGMAVPGFPNFFMLYGPNTNVGSNSVIFMLEAQARYVVRALKHMRRQRQVLCRRAAGQRRRTSSPRSTSGWTARCGPPGAATTSVPPTAGWSRSGHAVRVPSGRMTRRFRASRLHVRPPSARPSSCRYAAGDR